MSILKKSFTQTLDIEPNTYATGDSISMNVLDKEVYSLTLNIQRGGVALDLTPYTLEFSNTIAHTVTDAVNGVVDIVFDDISAYTANKSYNVTLKLTEGTIEKNFKAFKMSFYTVP